jgi:hypothetical protein
MEAFGEFLDVAANGLVEISSCGRVRGLILPFARAAFHRHATELTDDSQTTTIRTCFKAGFRARVASHL